MVKWSELSTEVQNKIIAYYEKRLDVTGMTAVKAALTQLCFEKAIDEVLDDVRKRKRRAKADEATAYILTDTEMAAGIQAKIDTMATE
jgi:ABC-type transporter MlaC component